MKTKEELNALKEEVEAVNKKLAELSEDELKEVVGGYHVPYHLESIDGMNRHDRTVSHTIINTITDVE